MECCSLLYCGRGEGTSDTPAVDDDVVVGGGAEGVQRAVVGAEGGRVDLGPDTVKMSRLGVRLKK